MFNANIKPFLAHKLLTILCGKIVVFNTDFDKTKLKLYHLKINLITFKI